MLRRRTQETIQKAEKFAEEKREPLQRTIEQQRQEQFDRLRSQFQSASQPDTEDIDEHHSSHLAKSMELQRESVKPTKVNVNLERKITPKGLIESVIMAEVLGPPRALNPYQNRLTKRK